jgi:hypothetical protein
MANLPKQSKLEQRSAAAAMLAAQDVAVEEDWLDAAQDVDQSTVDLEGPQYPYIQWVHGKKALKPAGGVIYTGGWFLNDAQGIEADDLPDWTPGELEHQQGDATAGFFIRDLTVAVIRSRRCWRVRDGDQTRLYAWDEYERAVKAIPAGGGLSGRLQVLVAVRGLEELGPLVLTMGGSVSRAFAPGKSGNSVMNVFLRSVITPANTLNRKRGVKNAFPYRAFWVAVGPDREPDGTPKFTTVGEGSAQSTVTLPIAVNLRDRRDAEDLGLGGKLTAQELGQLFVGRDNLALFSTWYIEAEEWANAWTAEALSGQRQAQDEAEEEAAEAEADNPAYVEEEQIPF